MHKCYPIRLRNSRVRLASKLFINAFSLTLLLSTVVCAQSSTEIIQAGQFVSVDQPSSTNADIDSGFTLLDSVDTRKANQARPTLGAVSGNRSLDKEAQALADAERAILARGKESTKETPKVAVEKAPAAVESAVNTTGSQNVVVEPSRAAVNISKVTPPKVPSRPERTILDRSAEVAQLQRDLAQSRRQNSELSTDLDKTRARLMTAETEVDRLSALLEGQDRRSAERYSPGAARAQQSSPARTSNKASGAAAIAPANAPQVGAGGELSIVTVAVDKAVARTAASRDSSPLMVLNRGTRLVVESRSGEWLRVLTPAGVRAWVTADAVVSGQAAVTRETAKSVAADAFGQDGF